MSTVRKKPSGRYEARYRDPAGRSRGKTFATKRAAQHFLDQIGTELASRTWRDPSLGKIRLCEYTTWWLENRPDLRPRTRVLYEGLLRLHIEPALGPCRFESLSPATVREWHTALVLSETPGPVTVAKAYRLLRSILNSAIADGFLTRNPCIIRGAGVERSPERPVATIEQVYALADAMGPRYRLMVLLATFCGLRLGEILALRRDRVDLLHRRIIVSEQRQELPDGTRFYGPPKTAAGIRSIALPPHLLEEVELHLDSLVGPEPDAFVFSGPRTNSLSRATFNPTWQKARHQVGLDHLHFHDLRHTGNTLAAATGASTKELMARMGHASARAALIYQHASSERDVTIAEGLSALAINALRQPRNQQGLGR